MTIAFQRCVGLRDKHKRAWGSWKKIIYAQNGGETCIGEKHLVAAKCGLESLIYRARSCHE